MCVRVCTVCVCVCACVCVCVCVCVWQLLGAEQFILELSGICIRSSSMINCKNHYHSTV